ncbi:MAG: RHS repeat-associated core domain-containing protein [Candidatus Polarisedimenticolia bacterium]
MPNRSSRLALLLGFIGFIHGPLLAAPPEVQDQLFYTIGQLNWSAVPGAEGYHVYRGDLSSFVTGNYGACLLGSVPGTTASVPANPPVGQGYFFLVGAFDESGAGPVGFSSGGVESFPAIPCKPNRRNFAMILDPSPDGLPNAEPSRSPSRETRPGPHGWTHVNLHSGEVVVEEAGYDTAFFKSLSGLKTESEVVDYQEGGVTHFTRKMLSPGKPWTGTGIGRKFDGKYLVQGCTHKYYHSSARYNGPMGYGWDFPANSRLRRSGPDVALYTGHGRVSLMRPSGIPLKWEGPDLDAVLYQEPDGSFLLRLSDGWIRRYHGFDGSSREGALEADEDPDGPRITYLYDHQGLLTTIVDQFGRSHTLEYDAAGRVVREADFTGRETISTYDTAGDRTSVRSPVVTGTPNGNDFPAGKTTRYTYSSGFSSPLLNHNLLSIRTPAQNTASLPVTRFDYGTNPTLPSFDRVVSQDLGDPFALPPVGGTITYAYQYLNLGADPPDPDIERRRTTITDRNGNIEERVHNGAGHPLSILKLTNRELRRGEPDYLTRHVFNADGQLLQTTTPEGSRHHFLWDSFADIPARGNLLQVRLEADSHASGGRGDGHNGEAADIVWNFTYEPVRNQVRSILTPRGHLVLIGYDYQEGDPAATGLLEMAARFQINLSSVPLGLGDLNGDGRLDQIAGRPVRRDDPPVALDPASQQAAIEGDTTQEIVTRWAWNDHGQLASIVDPEQNSHSISYHPENDPDGDGVLTPPPADGRPLAASEGGLEYVLLWDWRADLGRNNGTNPPQVAARVEILYDPIGRPVRMYDPRGVAHEWTHNQLDQVVEARAATAVFPATGYGEPGLTPLGFRTRYEYDANDNLVRVQKEDVGETSGAGPWVEHSFQYDALDNLAVDIREMTTGLDVEYRYAYDGNGNSVSQTTPEGVVQTMAWDERDLPLSSSAAASGPRGGLPVTRSYAYDGNGGLVRVVDGLGGLIDGAYDGFDRLVRTVDQVGNTSEIFHDPAGNVVRVLKRGPVGGPTPPDRSGATNVDLEDTLYAHDELERMTRAYTRLFIPAGAVPVRPPVLLEGSLVPGDGGINRWIEYDKLSRVTFDHDDTGTVSRYDYDGLGRLVKTTHPDGSTVDIAWDPAGNLIEEVETELPSSPGLLFERFFTTHMHDALGRSTITFDGIGHAERRGYNSLGALVFTSDPKGPPGPTLPRRSALGAGLSVQVNGHGNVTRYRADGQLQWVHREQVLSAGGQGDGTPSPAPVPTPANPAGIILNTFDWSPDSLLSAAHDGNGHTTSYQYDNAGRLVLQQADDGTHTTMDHDGEGNAWKIIKPGGTTIIQTHNPAMLLVTVVASSPTLQPQTQEFEYDGLSRLTRATDNNQAADPNDDSTVTFLHDSLSRQVEETSGGGGGGGGSMTSSMQWLGEDRPIGLVYPSGRAITYEYDTAGRLAFVADPSAGGGSSALQYFGMSRVHTQWLGNGARTTVLNAAGTADIGFDGARRLILMNHFDPNGAQLAAYEYRYDRGGNRTSQRRPHHPVPPPGQGAMGELYLYDSADRLVGFQKRFLTLDHLPSGPALDSQTWALDAPGNWASFTKRGVSYLNTPNNNNEYDEPQSGGTRVDDGVPDDFADPASTSVPDGVNMAHDINGNRLEDGVRYVYDNLDRLTRAERMDGTLLAAYGYDGLGRLHRRQRLITGLPVEESFGHWGDTGIATREGPALLGHELVHTVQQRGGRTGIDGKWKSVAGGGLNYLLMDALGSTVGLLDGAAPALLERVTYDPYGKPTFESPSNVPLTNAVGDPVAQSPAGNPWLFAGLRYEPETGSRSRIPAADRGGLYHTLHRAYSPNEGRFLTRDPLGAWGDPGSGGNAYAYAGGNPINFTDPSGLAYFNPKEVGLDKSVPWQKKSAYFNPKEYTITKATPWKHHDIQWLERSKGSKPSFGGSMIRAAAGGGPVIKHDHVYQHNQTDLEFIRVRAARLGHGWFGTVYKFSPRMSTANQVPRVIVRGWDPEKKQGIAGGTGSGTGTGTGTGTTFNGPPRIFILLPSSGPSFMPVGTGGTNFGAGTIPYINSVPSVSLFNFSVRNLPLIGSISVGFTIVPPAAYSGPGDVRVEYFGQMSNPFPFTKN